MKKKTIDKIDEACKEAKSKGLSYGQLQGQKYINKQRKKSKKRVGGFGVIDKPISMLTYRADIVGAASDVELPGKFVLSEDRIPPAENQFTTQLCLAFALAGAIRIFNRIETNKDYRLSPAFIYTQCRTHLGPGMFMNTTLDLLKEKGCCRFEEFPDIYDVPEILERAKEVLTDEIKERAKNHRIEGYAAYLYASREKNTECIKRALYENRYPILVSTDYFGERHAVLIIGWDNERVRFKILNSWGENWGDKGRGTITYNSSNHAYLLYDDENFLDKLPFADVSESEWYYKAIKKCYYAGIMQGVSDTNFEPERALTRAEMAQILYNTNNKLNDITFGKNITFKDVESDAWYNNAVGYCAASGLMQGVGGDEFEPERALTRGEAAQIFYNMQDRVKLPKTRDYAEFKDVDSETWYMPAIKYCYERNLINGMGDDKFLPEECIKRSEAAQLFYNYCKLVDMVQIGE